MTQASSLRIVLLGSFLVAAPLLAAPLVARAIGPAGGPFLPPLMEAPLPSLALLSDAGQLSSRVEDLRKSLLREHVQDVVMAGDNLYPLGGEEDEGDDRDLGPQPSLSPEAAAREHYPSYDQVWGDWFKSGLRFPVVAIGNHPNKHGPEMKYFGMPGEAYNRVLGGNKVRFIVLDSDNEDGVPAQLQWAGRQLATASEPMIFLVYHHPTYKIGRHSWKDKKEFQQGMRTLLARFRPKLTALIVGHDHLNTLVHFGDLPVILAAGTAEDSKAPPVDYSDNEDGMKVRTAWLNTDFGKAYWARMDFDPSRPEAYVRYIRAKDDWVACSFRLRTGSPARLDPNCLNRR